MFIYGTNYKRQINHNLFSQLKLFIFNWSSLTIFVAAIVLCFVRRLNRLRRDGFISVVIDVGVIFIGGGHLRMDHKLERWLFVIVSIGAFFLNAICLDSTLFPFYLLTQPSVDTFQQLAQINPPIYASVALISSESLMKEMLR